MPPTHFEWIDELELPASVDAEIRALLTESFPGWTHYAERSYYKQIGARRLLARQGPRLVGHLALVHRAVGLSDGPAMILGVVDLCVASAQRGQGHAAALLAEVTRLGRAHGAEFVVLFADDPRAYLRAGFETRPGLVRWLKIHEHETLGVADERVDELMVRALGARPWPEGRLDLLGHLF